MARNYNVTISFVGRDQASSKISKLGKVLGNMAQIAGGILGANLFMNIGYQIRDMAGSVFDAVASYEQLGFAMESLIAREISKGTVVEETKNIFVAATAEEKLRVMDLTQSIEQQESKLASLTAQYNAFSKNENARAALELQIKMDQLTASIRAQKGELQNLSYVQTGYVTQTTLSRVGTMDISEAYGEAAIRAKALLKWTRDLAIFSPFDMRSVADALRMAMAYGFTEEAAKKLTLATINYTAATGQSGEVAERIARALGQVQAKGRLMGEEIRQLTDASIPVVQILAEKFGKTEQEITSMVRAGLVPAQDAIDAIREDMERFGDAAERQFETWAGLRNAMGDIKELGMQAVFAPILDIFKPFVAEWIRWMSDEGGGLDRLAEFGEKTAGKLITFFKEMGQAFKILTTTDPSKAIGNLFGENSPIIDGAIKLRGYIEDFKGALEGLKGPVETIIPYLDDLAVTVGSLLIINKVSAGFKALKTLPGLASGIGTLVGILGGPWVLLAAAAIGALYWAWTNNIGGIQEILTDFWVNTLQPFIDSIVPWFQETIPLALEWLGDTWELVWGKIQSVIQTVQTVLTNAWAIIQPVIAGIAEWFMTYLWPALQAVGNFIGTVFNVVWTTLVNIWTGILLPALQNLWDIFSRLIWPILLMIGEYVGDRLGPVFELLVAIFKLVWGVLKNQVNIVLGVVTETFEFLSTVVGGLGDFINDVLLPPVMSLVEWLGEKVAPVALDLAESILPALESGFDAIGKIVDTVVGWIQTLVEWLGKVFIPDDLQQHSPSPFEQSIRDLGTAIRDVNNLPFLPNMNGVSMANVARGFGNIKGLVTPAVNELSGTIAGTDSARVSTQNNSNQNNIYISTTLGREELISLLEDMALAEGKF